MPALTFEDATHAYCCDGVPVSLSVTGVLTRAIHPSTLRPLVDFSGIPRETLAIAKARGSRVHKAIHFLLQGDLHWPSVDPDDVGYLESWQALVEVRRFRPVLCEHRIVSVKHDVAGTIDVIGHFEDQPTVGVIADFKTGKAEDVRADLQTGAYWGIACEWMAHDAPLRDVIRSYRTVTRMAFQVQREGRLPRVEHFSNPTDYRTFLGYLAQVRAPFTEALLP